MIKKRNVILAGVNLNKEKGSFESKIEETISLCEAAGYEVTSTIVQQSNSEDVKTVFRSGKLKELKNLVEMTNADLVIFYNDLRVQQAERIAAICGVEVIDRQALILNIFSLRARSSEAKLQVELARLQYDLPRAIHASRENEEGHLQGGSSRTRGAGEMRSSLIARKYSSRMAKIKKELQKVEIQQNQDERRRTKTLYKRVALVGYTNAGKSSLMNVFLNTTSAKGKQVYSEDMLFATLDTSVREIHTNGYSFFLYDTVGFVSDLPHTLIDAFKTTLTAARDADLLLHVIDCSDPNYNEKYTIAEETLKEIGANEIPLLRIYNKVDACENRPEGHCISCFTKEGIDELKKKIVSMLYPNEKEMKIKLPYARIAMADLYRKVLYMEEVAYEEDGIMYQIHGPKAYVDAFRIFQID